MEWSLAKLASLLASCSLLLLECEPLVRALGASEQEEESEHENLLLPERASSTSTTTRVVVAKNKVGRMAGSQQAVVAQTNMLNFIIIIKI